MRASPPHFLLVSLLLGILSLVFLSLSPQGWLWARNENSMPGNSLAAGATRKLAYVCLLCDNMMWKGAAVLLQSLQEANATAPLVVMALPNVSRAIKYALTALGAVIVVKEELPYPFMVPSLCQRPGMAFDICLTCHCQTGAYFN